MLSLRRGARTFTSARPTEFFDVCIVGGGIVGTALAAALSKSPSASKLKIALIDSAKLTKNAPVGTHGVFSNRVTSITPESVQFLKDAIAWIIENNYLLHSVVNALSPNVTILDNTKVLNISYNETWDGVKGTGAPFWPIVEVEDGRRIGTRLLVGADGANSIVRKFAGIESVGWDYSQNAIMNVTAYQKFLKHGPIALLPLSDNISSLVCDLEYLCASLDESGNSNVDIEEEVSWSLERYHKQMEGVKLDDVKVVGCVEGSRGAWPLRMRKAETYVQERIALVGDAAHTIHPLAGQGLNLGLSDAKCLADVLDCGVRDGQDIGQLHILQDYASRRYTPNLGMVTAVDAIGRLFRAEFEPIVWARSLGLKITDSIPALKNLAMRAAASL
ncbi:hypothetical protein BC829DRAFT_424441 [Chytridium lagenaria]|nr:hypothetical protein BC829DRAFT_424441 [Chytridium lagenaria]